jgi:CheY-like chemotaxis protein
MAHILVIDDDDSIRIALRKMLEGDGHVVVEAADGAEGMRLYWESPTDLVITDILMPEKEGFEVIRELRRTNPDVKIIAVSGNITRGGPDFLPQASDMGAAYTLPKPFTREQLLGLVRDALRAEPENCESGKRSRILIIDDDAEILTALVHLFEKGGHEIVTASTSEEGLEIFKQNPTDLVIADIFVPVEGGLEVIRKLKQSHPDSKIVAITGFGIRDELDAISLAKRMGADLAYEKPMDFKTFRSEVEALLG